MFGASFVFDAARELPPFFRSESTRSSPENIGEIGCAVFDKCSDDCQVRLRQMSHGPIHISRAMFQSQTNYDFTRTICKVCSESGPVEKAVGAFSEMIEEETN
jgi:hypothetical protein